MIVLTILVIFIMSILFFIMPTFIKMIIESKEMLKDLFDETVLNWKKLLGIDKETKK